MSEQTTTSSGQLLAVADAAALIAGGARVLAAGSEEALRQLPAGAWIGGTIPYFMTAAGETVSRAQVFVNPLPEQVTDVRVCSYGADELDRIPRDRFENGFSVVILPAGSDVHVAYAANAADFAGLFDQPVVGWVAGVHLDDLGKVTAKTFAANGGSATAERAAVLHAQLVDGVIASASILNRFRQNDGPTLRFGSTGFSHATVEVDGVVRSFAEFLREVEHDTRLPLVADYFGAMINTSFQTVPEDDGEVHLYAPVFEGIEYRLAAPIEGDYVTEFASRLPSGGGQPVFSCSCILNSLYSDLEGRKTGEIAGPITFGEVAFQLLNQTLVYLTIHD